MEDAGVRLDHARWHLTRYDNLQAIAASRASTVLSANALVLAGTTVLVGQAFGGQVEVLPTPRIIVVVGGVASFVFVALSVINAAQGLLALRPWRKRFGWNIPIEPFFQHNDTLLLLPTFEEFTQRFKAISPEEELDAALVALWVRINNIKARNEKVRRAIMLLLLAMVGLSVAVISLAVGEATG